MKKIFLVVLLVIFFQSSLVAGEEAFSLAIIGDSLSDESADLNEPNWPQILIRKRGDTISLGKERHWGGVRGKGREHNFAVGGATTARALKEKVHLLVSQTQVDAVCLMIGANDFLYGESGPRFDGFINLYSGTVSPSEFSALVLENLTTILAPLASSQEETPKPKIIISTIPSIVETPLMEALFPVEEKRQNVSEAIKLTNEGIRTLAKANSFPLIDFTRFSKKVGEELSVGGILLANEPKKPNSLFRDDGFHPGNIWHGLLTNLVILSLQHYGVEIKTLSDREILSLADLSPSEKKETFVDLKDCVWLPE